MDNKISPEHQRLLTAQQPASAPPSYLATVGSSSAPVLHSYNNQSSQATFKPQNPSIKKIQREAYQQLWERGLNEQKMRVCFVLDVSGSMNNLFNNGFVTELAAHLLALAGYLDDNNEIDVFPFGSGAEDSFVISAEESQESLHNKLLDCFRYRKHGGGTNYAAGLGSSRKFYQADTTNNAPVLRFILTDGDNIEQVNKFPLEAIEASNSFFIDKYLVLSQTSAPKKETLEGFPDLRWVDDGAVISDARPAYQSIPESARRTIDNADVVIVKANQSSNNLKITFKDLIKEVLEWLVKANQVGILNDDQLTYDRGRASAFLANSEQIAQSKGKVINVAAESKYLRVISSIVEARKQPGVIEMNYSYNPAHYIIHGAVDSDSDSDDEAVNSVNNSEQRRARPGRSSSGSSCCVIS